MADLNAILARDDKGRFSSVNEPTSVPPAETKPELTVVPKDIPASDPTPPAAPVAQAPSANEEAYKKAMRDEREKRQRAEARLRELEKPAPVVDPWADLPGTLQAQKSEFQEQLFLERCNLTEEIAEGKYKDYATVRDSFLEAAEADPTLLTQMRQQRNPAEFVYREGRRITELKDVGGDFTAYRSKIEKEVEARIRAEYAGKPHQPAAIPTSLNSDSSPPITESYAGPKSLNELLVRKRR